jgi:tetratricopeptide (TPR) repeat protein
MTLGTLLERQNRYEDAYQEHLKALKLTPLSNKEARIDCLIHLALAAFNAGRPVDCLHWAEEAIGLGATARFLRSAHRLAALACGNLGRLEDSEKHYHQAYEVAAAEKSNAHMAEILGCLAECLRKRGSLAEANEACLKAFALQPKGVRMARAVQAQTFRDWGRFDSALAAIASLDDTRKLVIPQMERRIIAVRALDSARIETEAGRANEAWPRIQEALAELSGDAKLSLKCDAAASWVLAARGLADESRRLADMLPTRLATFDADPSTQRGVLYDLGMAAAARSDYQAGIDCWTRYLALSPDPVNRPTANYQRGECHHKLGQLAEAREDYRSAAAMNLDTHYSALARRRLADLRWQSEIVSQE